MSADLTFALQVLPAFRKLGLGRCLLQDLIAVAQGEGGRRLKADVHKTNEGALRFLAKLGFGMHSTADRRCVCAAFDL